ncbi:MAG: enoyl-CoA hydratase/isomerase family protein [Gammaproteobacteria bacterium]|nr:enoyl-CoA hydratase/isomerase family protein [Gammaproteobacteria bacterium]MCP4088821.1 enoyl-CoA hydratase/isomerase family protein [Gammaproteobacteria bacterium]MCP4274837.1 enoyl-CoA hydratase/isomerase family protein [Gammaproteobacteria bacterium]MCP4832096.1 enoyl-CoA hydratase/isomerase family protein [Gammaproteobacteria bacterium]MCP4928303.1 enoyl-CoA hydratase/isomerase family protein [Gammaproteobacteria bacterium]
MLKIIEHGEVVELSLNRSPVNAMTAELMEVLLQELSASVAQGARAIIISGREGLFSAGLDVPVLIDLPRVDIESFWTCFFRTMHAIASSPVPVAAALTGHAPAGGTVLSLYCDYRVATRGKFSHGLNEVQVGLPVTRNVLHALELLTGARRAASLAANATLLMPEDALACGLVDELAEPGETVERCLLWAQNLLELPAIAMNKTRLAAKSDLIRVSSETSSYSRLAVDAWFNDEAQLMLRKLVEKLSS